MPRATAPDPLRRRRIGAIALLTACFVLAPRITLLGAVLRGHPASAFDSPFDPPGLVEHAAFSPLVFAIAAGALLLALARVAIWHRAMRRLRPPSRCAPRPWPRSGTLGLVLAATAWLVAWCELPGVAAVRGFTFTPIWVGYVMVVAALASRRGAPSFWRRPECPALFTLGAFFWCTFEYLNRFSENWIYTGVPEIGTADTLVAALLPFATVLPAVVATRTLLVQTSWVAVFGNCPKRLPTALRGIRGGSALVILGLAGLMSVSVWPTIAYPCVWLAPLSLTLGVLNLTGWSHHLQGSWQGDHREAVAWSTAGLVCGFFWEMWNTFSTCRWTYAVSYLGEPRLFEMPWLGYTGYLVFGLLCALVDDLVRHAVIGRRDPRRGHLHASIDLSKA